MGAVGLGLVIGWSALRYARSVTLRGWSATVAVLAAGLIGVWSVDGQLSAFVFLGITAGTGLAKLLLRLVMSAHLKRARR